MTVDMTAAELRQRLRRVGIWMPPPERTGIDPAMTAAAIEGAGFTSVWVGGGNAAPDAFERLRPMLAGSSRLIVATGIANVWAWEPGELRAAAEALAADFPGRFILGLGEGNSRRRAGRPSAAQGQDAAREGPGGETGWSAEY